MKEQRSCVVNSEADEVRSATKSTESQGRYLNIVEYIVGTERIRMACVFCSCHHNRLLRFSESHAQMTASVGTHAQSSWFYKKPELAQLM